VLLYSWAIAKELAVLRCDGHVGIELAIASVSSSLAVYRYYGTLSSLLFPRADHRLFALFHFYVLNTRFGTLAARRFKALDLLDRQSCWEHAALDLGLRERQP